MSKAIVIATYNGREDWLRDCLESLAGYSVYPTLTINEPYELGVIKWIYEHTDLEEFILLQDSVRVKQYGWLDEVFAHDGSVSMSHQQYFMYLGKYTRKGLSKLEIPKVQTKRESIRHEDEWTSHYARLNDTTTLWPLQDTDIFEERHGRRNMVLENNHIVKYKGTWHPNMISD